MSCQAISSQKTGLGLVKQLGQPISGQYFWGNTLMSYFHLKSKPTVPLVDQWPNEKVKKLAHYLSLFRRPHQPALITTLVCFTKDVLVNAQFSTGFSTTYLLIFFITYIQQYLPYKHQHLQSSLPPPNKKYAQNVILNTMSCSCFV